MILIDTNVLVALVDVRDPLRAAALRDLKTIAGPYAITSVVLSEACFLLPEARFRERIRLLIAQLRLQIVELDGASWETVFDWLLKYAEHEPDLCDAQLCVLASRLAASIWSYDTEFRDLWRAPGGKPLSMLPKDTRTRRRRRPTRIR